MVEDLLSPTTDRVSRLGVWIGPHQPCEPSPALATEPDPLVALYATIQKSATAMLREEGEQIIGQVHASEVSRSALPRQFVLAGLRVTDEPRGIVAREGEMGAHL